MFKILNSTLYSVFFVMFAVLLVAVPSNYALAAEKQESQADKITALMTQIQTLINLVKDRQDFLDNKASLIAVDHSIRSEDFFLRLGEDSPVAVYGQNQPR